MKTKSDEPPKMVIRCAYDKIIPIAKLKPNPKNRNKHPKEQIKRLAQILAYQGIRRPVRVSKRSGLMTVGHGMLEAAILNGWKLMPVNMQDYDNEEMELADLTADNAIGAWAELDLSGINTDFVDLGPDFDIDLLGIKDFVIEPADKAGQCDEDYVPEKAPAIAKLGDVFKLGEHRLMCGDSAGHDDVKMLLGGGKVDMVCTDPPYGINYVATRNWAKPDDDTRDIIGDAEPYDFRRIHNPKIPVWAVWGANYFCETIPDYKSGNYVVWAKAHSDVENDVFGSAFELVWMYPKHKQMVWFVRRVNMGKDEHGLHPTQKPIEIIERCLDYHSMPKNSLILDLYGGSGSTLIACEKTNRKCFMMEIDPLYVDVIIARWEKYTGKKAELQKEKIITRKHESKIAAKSISR